jgi:hypothetical protein
MPDGRPDPHDEAQKKVADVAAAGGWRDPLFDEIHTPAANTGVTVLRGYIGDSGAGIIRLYSSPEFSDYIDIPAQYVVKIVDLRLGAGDTLAGQAVWVTLDAEITHGSTGVKQQSLRSLVSGDISGLRGGEGGVVRTGGGLTPTPWCGGGQSPGPWCGYVTRRPIC